MSAPAGLATASGRERRSQAERRAATREALLDAALAALLEDGYGGLTTRRVAERAGVSQGTLRFHFAGRAEFVSAAVERLMLEIGEQLREQKQTLPRTVDERQRIEMLLDQIWQLTNGPLLQALTELWAAARTEPEIRDSLALVNRIVAGNAAEIVPDLVATQAGRGFLTTTLASMRGIAALAAVDPQDAERSWQATRRQLLVLYDSLDEQGADHDSAGQPSRELAAPQRRRAGAAPRGGEKRRAALLTALEDLLAERSLAEIGVAEITQRAHVTRSAFYFHFPTKEAAVAALIEGIAAAMTADGLAGFTAEGLTGPERCRRMMESTIGHWRAHVRLFVAFFDAVGSDAEVRAALDNGVRLFVETAATFIEDQRAAGFVRPGPDARTLAATLIGMNANAAERDVRSIAGGEAPDELLVDTLTEIWTQSLFDPI